MPYIIMKDESGDNIILENDYMDVYNGGRTSNNTINTSGFLTIFSGGTAGGTTVNSGGRINVYNGGTVNGASINYNNAYLYVFSGGTANDPVINDCGYLIAHSKSTVNHPIVNSGGNLYIASGGTALDIVVNGGCVEVRSGATATFVPNSFSNIFLSHYQYIYLHSGTTATGTTVVDESQLYISSGGVAYDTTVRDTGIFWIYSGGVAYNNLITSTYSDCALYGLHISSGATTYDTTIDAADFYVSGTANRNILMGTSNQLGRIWVADKGIVNSTDVYSAGVLQVYAGGTARDTTIYSGGKLYIWHPCGVASNTMVNPYAMLYVSASDGVANGATVHFRGTFSVCSGGTMTGQLTFMEGALVSAKKGAVLDFDISELDPGAAVRVNKLSRINGTPIYTLTVSDEQADGIYSLAYGAGSFNSTITVVNTSGSKIGTLTVGKTTKVNGDDYMLNRNDGKLMLYINTKSNETTDPVTPAGADAGNDVCLANAMPEAEYMYGCSPTAIGMLLGYYDLYGYGDKDFTNMIEGDVDLKSRGTDGDAYDMDAFDTVLGRAIASEEYVYRFHSRNGRETTPTQELEYAFKEDGKTLNTDVWNCIADYLGTGQYWRGNSNLSTSTTFGSLKDIYRYDHEVTIKSGSISRTIRYYEYDMLYGLDLYVQSRGYKLDTLRTGTYSVDVAGGDFTFADYMKEIDEGRPVLLSIQNHSMVGYGYNADTLEIIFDDCYKSGQRMVWDGTYNYSGAKRKLMDVSIIVLDESSGDPGPKKATVSADITELTNQDVSISAVFGETASSREFSINGTTWHDYTGPVTVSNNGTVYFRSTDDDGNISAITAYNVMNIDKSLPDKPVVSADITAPTTGYVIVSASFAEEAVSREYSYDGVTWDNYIAPLIFTENGVAYFRCTNAEGKQSVATRYEVTNIDRTAPALPVVFADVTAPTNDDVLVFASFGEDAVSGEYSRDGETWSPYTEAVRCTGNGTIHFRCTDAAGNVSNTARYKVSNIDRIPPAKPTLSASVTDRTSNDVFVTAKFSGDSVTKEYSFNGATWSLYTEPVKFTENGSVCFRGTDAAGNESEIAQYDVTNIDKSMLDGGNNNYLYDKKKEIKRNPDSNLASVTLKSGISGILLDEEGLVQQEDMHNFVGIGDEADFAKITLKNAARLFFSISATDAMTFTVWRLVEGKDRKGNVTYTQKSLQATSLKKVNGGTGYAAETRELLLDAGEYYISAQSTNKKNGFALYNVELREECMFFTQGDNSDDWTDLATTGPDGFFGKEVTLSNKNEVVLDGWVGFGDSIDYGKISLESNAKLCFSLESTNAAKFTIWKLTQDRKGNWTLKALQSTALTKPKRAEKYSAATKTRMLGAGDYYISMQSTNAKKCNGADYTATFERGASVFFVDHDDGLNDWAYNKKKEPAVNSDDNLVLTTITAETKEIFLDKNGVSMAGWNNFVGYEDADDYAKITLSADAKLSFIIEATDASRFVIYRLTGENGKYKLNALQTNTLRKPRGAEEYKTTTGLLALSAGEYYISMQSTNAKTGGAAYYNVFLNTEACDGLPQEAKVLDGQVADALTMQDDLTCFCQYSKDVPGLGAFAELTAQKTYVESGLGILASL